MSKTSIIKEFLEFLIINKKWWLIPLVLSMLMFATIIFFSQSSAIAPFIYAIF